MDIYCGLFENNILNMRTLMKEVESLGLKHKKKKEVITMSSI